ncbi:MAG TPA: hypothetical protein PK765_04780 [bacterium]|nr:hypothetical protein [bacterium]
MECADRDFVRVGEVSRDERMIERERDIQVSANKTSDSRRETCGRFESTPEAGGSEILRKPVKVGSEDRGKAMMLLGKSGIEISADDGGIRVSFEVVFQGSCRSSPGPRHDHCPLVDACD